MDYVLFVCCFLAFVAHIPLYLYPFLNTVSKNRPFEYLRLTSLGVIGALVKVRPDCIYDHCGVSERFSCRVLALTSVRSCALCVVCCSL